MFASAVASWWRLWLVSGEIVVARLFNFDGHFSSFNLLKRVVCDKWRKPFRVLLVCPDGGVLLLVAWTGLFYQRDSL